MLLDTHVALWLSLGIEIAEEQDPLITQARNDEGVWLSAVTVWEIGNLVRKGRLQIEAGLAEWIQKYLRIGGIHPVSLSVDIALEAATLPPPFHTDPADRFLVATARHMDIPIMTRDQRILDYALAGHVKAIAC